MLQDKKAKFKVNFYRIFSKIQLVTGGFLVLLLSYTTIFAIVTENILEQKEGFITLIVFLILAFIPLILGIKNSILINQLKKYLPRLINDKTHSIDQLANGLDQSELTVKQRLKKMIAKGYFTNAYIDRDTNCVIFAGTDNLNDETYNTYTSDYDKIDGILSAKNTNKLVGQGQYKIVTCTNCGTANKVIENGANACEYCGIIID